MKLDEFFKKANDPNYTLPKSEYRNFFLDGVKKIEKPISFISNLVNDFSKIVIIEVGSSNAAGLVYALTNTSVKYAISLEYGYKSCNEARKNWGIISKRHPEKELLILSGDAPSNSKNVRTFLNNLYTQKKINGVFIICQSVLHELPFRSVKEYNHYRFILNLMQDLPNIYLYIKEPIGLREYRGEVQLSIPSIDTNDLFRFATIIKEKLSFSGEIIKGFNFISLDGRLASEVIKKLVYFAENGSVNLLRYEMEESHTAFNPDKFCKNVICKLFKRYNYEFVNSETFKRNFLNLNISIKSVNNNFLSGIIPKSFVVFTAWKTDKAVS